MEHVVLLDGTEYAHLKTNYRGECLVTITYRHNPALL